MKKRNAKMPSDACHMHFDALEKEMKSEIKRLKTGKKRLEDDVVALQGRLVSCEETLCGANKRIWYLKKSNAQLRISCALLAHARFKDAVKQRRRRKVKASK